MLLFIYSIFSDEEGEEDFFHKEEGVDDEKGNLTTKGLVLVDKQGKCIRRPMTYMDQRAREEIKKGIAHGVQVAGAEVTKLLKYLKYTGAVSSSVKDPIWKYKWVEAHEPENFKRIYKWLDVKEYMILRCSGEFVMTNDSAFGTAFSCYSVNTIYNTDRVMI